jgi:phosphatidylinositol alpha-mannosyltransferase
MNVAIVCPYSFSSPGGVQEHARGLAMALHAMGHEVSVLAPEMRDRADGIVHVSLGRAMRVPANGSVAPLGVDPRMLVRFDLALDPADVVHVHEPFLPASIAASLRTPRSVPVVGTFHAAAARSTLYAIARPVLARLARRLCATTAVSPDARRLVTRYVRVEPDVVPNGVDADAFAAAAPDPWMAGLGRTVLFTGRPEPRKGFDLLLRAFAAVAASRPDWHLVCSAAREAVVHTEGVASRVHCLGVVARERLLALYKAADIVCAPSLGGESFGLVVLEGLAAGRPVLASDISGYRFAGGDAPEYVAPGDVRAWRRALERAADDEAHRMELGARGPARARELDWRAIAARTFAVYERCL